MRKRKVTRCQRGAVVANINALVGKARAEGVAIVWVQHSDDRLEKRSDDWKYVLELVRQNSEPVAQKTFGDSLEGIDLEQMLEAMGSAA